MTAHQRLGIWLGALLVGLIVAWFVLDQRAGELQGLQAQATELGVSYARLYPENGLSAAEAERKWKSLMEHQEGALHEAQATLVPPLPRDYQDADLSSATALVHRDHSYLRNKAQRLGGKLPQSLPLDDKLDINESLRGMQLAQLYLLRQVVDAVLEAKPNRPVISSLRLGKGSTDPDQRLAVLLCEVDTELPFAIADQLLLEAAQQWPRKGLSLRNVSIEPRNDPLNNLCRVQLTASLRVPNQKGWGLKPEAGLNGLKAGSGPITTGQRPGRLGGH